MNQSSALYGKSFYDLAKEEKITKEVLEEMELVKALFSGKSRLYSSFA